MPVTLIFSVFPDILKKFGVVIIIYFLATYSQAPKRPPEIIHS